MLTNSRKTEKLSKLKFALLSEGINLPKISYENLKSYNYRVPKHIRSGASYGLEAVVDKKIYVNIPINSNSRYSLSEDCKCILSDDSETPIRILKNPSNLKNKGNVCFDRLGITLTSNCYFVEKGLGCRFCGIQCKYPSQKKIQSIEEVKSQIKNAIKDEHSWVKHILISSGAFPPPDFGADIFAEYVKQIKQEFPFISIYAMLPPPIDSNKLDILLKSEVDEIAMNIELFGELSKQIVPGKHSLIGLDKYLYSLEYLAKRKKRFSVRSILMTSIEDQTETLRGVQELSQRGVMPILSYYRKSNNSFKEAYHMSGEDLYTLWKKADKIACNNDNLLGPLCIPCQNNTIAFPNNNEYKFY
jgi:lipoate synthase